MAEITQTEDQVDPKLDESKLPKDVRKVLALLAEAQELPSSNRSEHIIKAHQVNRITAHLHAIQQGPEAPIATAQNTRAVYAAQNENAKKIMAESLCRQYPVLKEYVSDRLEEIAALKAELETLKNPKK